MILSTSLPVRHIFVVLAICPAVFALCIYAVDRMHRLIPGREALAATETGMAFATPGQRASV